MAGQTMTTAADAPVAGGSAAGSTGQNMMGSMLGTVGSMAGQVGSAAQPLMTVAGAFPQLASQVPSLFSSMLGPLSSGSGLGAADAAGLGSVSAAPALAGALAGGGGAGGGGLLSAGGMASTFVRPASSFAEPAAPKLPGGWQGGGGAAEPVAAQPSGVGGGGLYGAPAAMGRDGGSSTLEKAPPKTMQVTARSAANRGEHQRN